MTPVHIRKDGQIIKGSFTAAFGLSKEEKIQINLIFKVKGLHIPNFCSTFAVETNYASCVTQDAYYYNYLKMRAV